MTISPPTKVPGRPAWFRSGWGKFFLVIVAVFLFLAGLFGYLVSVTYQKFRQGNDQKIDVSSFSETQSFTRSGTSTSGRNTVPRTEVETTDDPILGPAQAPVTIVEFGDFECPFCAQAVFVLKDLLAAYPKQIRIIYRDFPISAIHAQATLAAEAAACMNDQGRFWEFHDLLYVNQDRLDGTSLEGYASQVGANVALFQACLSSNRFVDEVQADYEAGLRFGVRGTPTWFVNGHRIEGLLPLEILRKIVEFGIDGQL